jgi:tRNA C32,U32 (ribose-2'-O)-methylase TrmJ
MAVQIVAYELFLARRTRERHSDEAGDTPLATVEEMERFYAQFAEVLEDIDFKDRHGGDHLMQRLRRLFNRVVLDQNEANILRGILTAVQGRRRRAGAPPVPRSTDPA